MSKRQTLLKILNQETRAPQSDGSRKMAGPALLNSNVDEIYLHRLEKDIERVRRFNKQADLAIENLTKYENSPIEKRLIALGESYEKIPYVTDKDDTIGVAATTNILDDMIKRTEIELLELKLIETQSLDSLIKEYRGMLTVIAKTKQDKEDMIELLRSKSDDVQRNGFHSNIEHQILETKKVKKILSSHLKRIMAKYLAISATPSEEIHERDELKRVLIDCSKMIDNLLVSNEWVPAISYSHAKFMIDSLVKNDVLLIKETDIGTLVKLRGFDIS